MRTNHICEIKFLIIAINPYLRINYINKAISTDNPLITEIRDDHFAYTNGRTINHSSLFDGIVYESGMNGEEEQEMKS